MPDATQTEVGRRLYHVHREKRVENAIKKMMHGVGRKSFSNDDLELLGHLLQCTWNCIDQDTWEKIPFANVKKGQIQQILSCGEGVRPGKNPTPEAIEEIKLILFSIS